MSAPPIPPGYHTLTPYLIVDDLPKMVEFLTKAFGAVVHEQVKLPDGETTHIDVLVGNSHVMIGKSGPGWPAMPCMLYLYTEDVDAMYASALEAGATSLMEPSMQTYGNRDGGVMGPMGNYWWIATQVEEVSSDELNRREAERRKKNS